MKSSRETERRGVDRQELERLKLEVLRGTASLNPDDPEHRITIKRLRQLLRDTATAMGMVVKKDTPASDTQILPAVNPSRG